MSITKSIALGAGATWFSRGMTILLGLLLMPVLFAELHKEELGVWMLLGQTWMVMGILDFGLTPTITRKMALAKGKSGSDPHCQINDLTRREIADLVESGKRIYRWLSILGFVISFVIGFYYLRQIPLTTLSVEEACIAWGVLCLAQALGIWASIWTSLLQGMGFVGWEAILASLVSSLVLLSQIAALFLGGGLVALALVAAVGALSQRYLILGFAKMRRPELFALEGSWNPAMVRSIVPSALRSWTTSLGTVLVMNTDQYFIAATDGLKDVPAYRAAYLLLYNLSCMSTAMAGASAVFVSHLWQSAEIDQIHRVVFRNLRFGLGVMAAGGACILVLGNRLFDVWLGVGNFIGYPCLILFFALLILESQSFIITASSRATEDEAYAISSMMGGALKLIFAWILARRYGVVGIAASTLLAQFCTNHWYMVYTGMRRLQISLRTYFSDVIVPVICLFAAVLLAVSFTLSFSVFQSGMPSLFAGTSTAGIVLSCYMWLYVLESGQRTRLNHWFRMRIFR